MKADDEHPEGHSHQDDVALCRISLRVKVSTLGMNNTGSLSPLQHGEATSITGKSLADKGNSLKGAHCSLVWPCSLASIATVQ